MADQIMTTIIDRHMSIRKVAEETGIPRATLQRHVRADLPFTTDELGQLAHALDVDPVVFVAGFEPV